MAADKVGETLVEALKRALTSGAEQRLFRSGKLEGLFPSRGGINAEAAAEALRAGLLVIVKTETRGKTTFEWVRATPKAVDWLHEHESPLRMLQELRQELVATRAGVPGWQAELRRGLGELSERLMKDSENILQRMEILSQRIDEALQRLALAGPALPPGIEDSVPWARASLDYLERRRSGGVEGPCPLPELFHALLESCSGLSIAQYHEGLRRLRDRRVVTLLPCESDNGVMTQPEYALLDGGYLLYYAAPEGGRGGP